MPADLTRAEVEDLLARAADSARSQWEPSDADWIWMCHGEDLARALLAAWDERDAAMAILAPGSLATEDGAEVPTTLVERARWVVAALGAEDGGAP